MIVILPKNTAFLIRINYLEQDADVAFSLKKMDGIPASFFRIAHTKAGRRVLVPNLSIQDLLRDFDGLEVDL